MDDKHIVMLRVSELEEIVRNIVKEELDEVLKKLSEKRRERRANTIN